MEGVGQRVVFVILIAISIVSQVVKSNAKKRQQMQKPTNHQEQDDYWGEYYDIAQENSQSESDYYKDTSIRDTKQELYRIPHKDQFKGNVVRDNTSDPISIESVELQESNVDLSQFDLEDAIIYSEIINPKFKEYEHDIH